MPCETCGHTIQNIGGGETGRRTFWCPRCGSLTMEIDGPHGTCRTEHEPPRLVCRARELLALLGDFGELDAPAHPISRAKATVRESIGGKS